MKKVLIATVAATIFAVVSPAFANPAYEAEWDYAGWRDAQQSIARQQVETRNSQLIYRPHRVRR
jgi:hypothetical protein